MWTKFLDMHSGGDQKLNVELILIELPQSEAEAVFQALFKRDPHNISCDCCGRDYSVDEFQESSLEEIIRGYGDYTMRVLTSEQVDKYLDWYVEDNCRDVPIMD